MHLLASSFQASPMPLPLVHAHCLSISSREQAADICIPEQLVHHRDAPGPLLQGQRPRPEAPRTTGESPAVCSSCSGPLVACGAA